MKYWPKDTIPIDVYKIAEYELGLEIIPVSNLFRNTGVEASLLGDASAIVVDSERFWDDHYENRLRFSIAHEIGHKALHSNLYNISGVEDVNILIDLFCRIPQSEYHWIETQANQFAGRLLIPTNKLIEKVTPYKEIIQIQCKGIPSEQIADFLAGDINDYFKVSEEAMSIRLKNEKIIDELI